MATADMAQSGEAYCPECGEQISNNVDYCPNCGAAINRQSASESKEEGKHRISQTGYLALGILSGVVSFLFIPVVFGPISILAGAQLFRHYDERYGIAVMALGGVGLVLGMIIGAMTATGL